MSRIRPHGEKTPAEGLAGRPHWVTERGFYGRKQRHGVPREGRQTETLGLMMVTGRGTWSALGLTCRKVPGHFLARHFRKFVVWMAGGVKSSKADHSMGEVTGTRRNIWGPCCSRVILGAKRHDVVTVGNVASATEELSFKFYFTLINFKCK